MLAHAHAFGIVAIGAERRGTRRADPLAATLVTVFLLVEALLQGAHQRFETAHRLDLRLLFFSEHQLGLLPQPFIGDVPEQIAKGIVDALEIRAENTVEAIQF